MELSDLMVDIETLGHRPTSVILSIGAVVFSPEENRVYESFDIGIHPDDCQRHGLTIDASTVRWWTEQPEDARKAAFSGGFPLSAALSRFSDWIHRQRGIWGGLVWARSPSFDLAILKNAFGATGRGIPWKYWDERDHRTVFDHLPEDVRKEIEAVVPVGTKHVALADALYQARTLSQAVHWLKTKQLPDMVG